ncbi:hypothetical protein [Nostoc sp. FACHB-133]|nr:hypothetical protein [Nostoc sp. FACHB-133]MBD2527923.1 hypothetical protein [Nostoc sp. FACHB-133]
MRIIAGGRGNINLRSPTAGRSPSRDILLLRRGSSITGAMRFRQIQ